ncbi:hypothetical protein GCM10010246_56750 [Streptomyces cuspidosporus]|uniref:Uncharacterized protein n=1 Tax=Streptomyces cuspidosporus TaxID=66882 RepID=A0ABN3GS10_9ACTN
MLQRGLHVGRHLPALCTAVFPPVLAAGAVPAGVEQHPFVAPGIATFLALRPRATDDPRPDAFGRHALLKAIDYDPPTKGSHSGSFSTVSKPPAPSSAV